MRKITKRRWKEQATGQDKPEGPWWWGGHDVGTTTPPGPPPGWEPRPGVGEVRLPPEPEPERVYPGWGPPWGGLRPEDLPTVRRKKPRPPPNLESLEKQLEKALRDRERGVGKGHKPWELMQNRRIEMLQNKIHSHPDYEPPQRFINPPRPPGWDEKVERRKKVEAGLEAGMSIEEIKGRMRPPEEIGVGRVRPPYWDRPIETESDIRVTTLALGEEDGMVGKPIRPPKVPPGRVTTMALGEEDGVVRPHPRDEPRAITLRIGEYDDRLPPGYRPVKDKLDEPRAITMMIGEYDNRLPRKLPEPRGTKDPRILKERLQKLQQVEKLEGQLQKIQRKEKLEGQLQDIQKREVLTKKFKR